MPNLSYRYWFFLAMLLFLTVTIFGCFLLMLFGRISLG